MDALEQARRLGRGRHITISGCEIYVVAGRRCGHAGQEKTEGGNYARVEKGRAAVSKHVHAPRLTKIGANLKRDYGF